MKKLVTFHWESGAVVTIEDEDLYGLLEQYGQPKGIRLEKESQDGSILEQKEVEPKK